jgi:hypothetical protein
MIERGHKPIIEALARMSIETGQSWVGSLHAVLFADRTTVHRPTEVTPFELVYGRHAVLPMELKHPTWRIREYCAGRNRHSRQLNPWLLAGALSHQLAIGYS